MHRYAFIILVFLVIGEVCLSQVIDSNRFSGYIVQDGEKIYVHQHEVKLKKAPFEIWVNLPKNRGVFVNASFSSDTYTRCLENWLFGQLPGFQNTATFEVWGNLSEELLISETTPHFWFVKSPQLSRFSRYQIVNNRLIGVRKVTAVYHEVKKERIPIENVNQPIYLSFLMFRPLADDMRYQELMRHELKLTWVTE